MIGDEGQRYGDTKFRHPVVRSAQSVGWAERSEAHVFIDDGDEDVGTARCALAHSTLCCPKRLALEAVSK